MIITLIILFLIIGFILIRYNPTIDTMILGLNKVLILWYNTDWKGLNRDYIILWQI